ncbi:MAG TPA: ABC transporter permease [Gemmataceae bacterium]|nr:ABC transporter permease [Gemmataceae bacterium]
MSKAITERPEYREAAGDWQSHETAPSLVRVDEPTLGRFVGFVGLMCLALGGTALGLTAAGWTRGIGPTWGSIFSIAGLACLLFHALCDSDVQVRRVYGLVGFLWLIVGVALTALPIKGPAGSLFLPYGYACLGLALLFLLPFARHETEPKWHRITVYTLGGVGAVLAATGFLFGSVNPGGWFLLPYGAAVAILGVFYLAAFISFTGISSDLGYLAGLAVGAAGLVVFLVALVRSLLAGPTESYFVPNGLVLMSLGVVYMALSAGLCLDNRLVVMTRRELATFFYSPIAYFVLLGLTVVGWYFYWDFVMELSSPRARLVEPVIKEYLWGVMPIICVIFIVPVLTMRLLSEEQRIGTLEVLLTAPIDEVSVVLSKFLAVWLFYLLLWLPWGLFLIALRVGNGEPFEYRPLLTFYIMQACLGANFLAMGLFFSSLTRNQIIAAVLTFAGMVGWVAVNFMKWRLEQGSGPTSETWVTILTHVSFVDLWWRTLDGVLLPNYLLFHVSAAVFWLFLTVKVLESRKWR